MMMKTAVLTAILVATGLAQAAPYKLDATHTEVGFKVQHLMISDVKGRFNKYEGSFDYDEKKNELKAIDVKIEAASIDTNNKDRDAHLNSDEFFATKKFPLITFKSDKIDGKDPKNLKVSGTLTIHGVSKPVVLDVVNKGSAVDPWGNEKVGFSATTKVNRKDFGLNWNKALDKGGVALGEEVSIMIDGEAAKDVPKKK